MTAPNMPDQSSNRSATDGPRRLYPRMEVRAELVAQIDGNSVTLPLTNLSYGGAFFHYRKKKLPVGETIELQLQEGEEAATCGARVVHSNSDGFAVSFVEAPFNFTAALSRLLTRQILQNTQLGAGENEVPGRIGMLLQQGPDYEVLFTSTLGKNGVWVLTDRLWAYSETLWVTLLEHGMFDCEARVLWCTEDAMALDFIDPSEEFNVAYARILEAFVT